MSNSDYSQTLIVLEQIEIIASNIEKQSLFWRVDCSSKSVLKNAAITFFYFDLLFCGVADLT